MWWRDPCAAAAGEAEGALELGAAREHVAVRRRQAARARSGPRRASAAAAAAARARPAARSRRCACGSAGRGARNASAIGRQPRDGILVLVRDRLVGDVAARHHQRLADVGEQQVVQRAVREHHAQLRRPRRDRGGHPGAGPARGEHDRPVAAAQQRRLDAVELDQLARGVEVGGHQRERLLLAVLARAQRRDRVARRPPGRRDGTPRCPSPRRSPPACNTATARVRGSVPSLPARNRRQTPLSAGRSRGRRSAGRGSGGRRGRGTRPRTARTS